MPSRVQMGAPWLDQEWLGLYLIFDWICHERFRHITQIFGLQEAPCLHSLKQLEPLRAGNSLVLSTVF